MTGSPDAATRPGLIRSLRDLTQGRQALIWLALALAPAFSVTALVAEWHRAEYRQQAQEWQLRGEDALREGRSIDAIDSFRSALRFARDDRTLRLRLAEALALAGQPSEARAYLQDLWQEQPGNGRVNLELARIAAVSGNVDDATRYYQTAVQGAWEDAAAERRRETRVELASYLIQQGRPALAEAELVALAAGLAPDAPLRNRAGELLLAAGSPRRARDVFDAGLKVNPADAKALRGAAQAALALGDHAGVVRYLQRVPAGLADEPLRLTLEVSRQVLALDPYRRGLSSRERAARVRRALTQAAARLGGCDQTDEAMATRRESMTTALRRDTVTVLARDPERLDAAFAEAVSAIRAAGDACGDLTPSDRALLLLAPATPEIAQ
jgi:tetratricopeptide (TPR) repeat protein